MFRRKYSCNSSRNRKHQFLLLRRFDNSRTYKYAIDNNNKWRWKWLDYASSARNNNYCKLIYTRYIWQLHEWSPAGVAISAMFDGARLLSN